MKTLYKITLLFAFVLLLSNFTSAQTEREKGIEYYLKDDYQNAIETLQKVVEADDTDRDGWMYLGMSFAKLKKRDKAASAFKKADKLPKKELTGNEKDVNILSKPRAAYTDLARMNQIQGTIALAIEFGEDGQLKFIFAFQVLPDGLTRNTLDAAAKIKFEPATKNGKPVSTIRIMKYSFAIY
jgi:tetratricopeptide (TPR) repeat protein